MSVNLIFVEDEAGVSQVRNVLVQIETQAKTNTHMQQLYELIIKGFSFLQQKGMPDAEREIFITEKINGHPYSIQLVKTLKNHSPLLEFRINWPTAGAFRAIFFEWVDGDEHQYLVVRALIKQTTFSEEFEQMIREVEAYREKMFREVHSGEDEDEKKP